MEKAKLEKKTNYTLTLNLEEVLELLKTKYPEIPLTANISVFTNTYKEVKTKAIIFWTE